MTYEVQQTRWDRLIRRVSGSIGPGSRVSETISELFPVLDVENVPAELLFLSGTKVAWGAVVLGASAGNTNHHQLFNPAGSGHVLTLTTIIVSTVGSAATWEAQLQNTPLTTDVGNSVVRDTRQGVAVNAVGQMRSVQQAAGLPAFMSIRQGANVAFLITDPNGLAVLFPGTGYTVAPADLNIPTNVSFWWRERVFESSEELSG